MSIRDNTLLQRNGLPKREGLWADMLNPRTYKVLLYILLAAPAGILISSLITIGVVAGVFTLPILIGGAFLLGALWLVGGLGDVQRFLAGLLGVKFAQPPLPENYPNVMTWVRTTLADPATYRTLLFHVIQLPLALLCWVVLAGLVSVMVLGLAAPFWAMSPSVPLLVGEWSMVPSPLSVVGLMIIGVGSLFTTAGVINLMGRVWTRLVVALLSRDVNYESARREVIALRRAAGQVALGNDLQVTLADLTEQARAASTATAVALVSADGMVRAASGIDKPDYAVLATKPDHLPAAGEADMRHIVGGLLVVTLPVALPASAGLAEGETLRALYSAGVRPSGNELAFLLSIADHAGTALHAAQLIERAGMKAGEQERARLARELHDSVAQALYGITLGAKTARATLEKDPAKTRASLDYTIRLAEGGVSEMKALLFSLRPDALEEGGLVAALTQHAHALEARHGLTVHADLKTEPVLSPQGQEATYRIAQEALHNVVKHARASEVWLSLKQQNQRVILSVKDNGRGFDPLAQGRGTLGQRSMRERAVGIGGQLSVLSEVGLGTEITLTVPLEALATPTTSITPTTSAVLPAQTESAVNTGGKIRDDH